MRNLYVVLDHVAEESGPIFEAKTDGVALRQYQRMLLAEGVEPGDYSLICVGEFDHEANGGQFLVMPRVVEANLNMDEEDDV